MYGPIFDMNTNTAKVDLEILQFAPDQYAYKMRVGYDAIRYFYDNTLPDLIKQRLAVINSFKEWGEEDYLMKHPVGTYLFNSKLPPELEDIGWRTGEYKYCIIVPLHVVEELRGEILDPRSKSKKEG